MKSCRPISNFRSGVSADCVRNQGAGSARKEPVLSQSILQYRISLNLNTHTRPVNKPISKQLTYLI